MAVYHGTPPIVTDGLIFILDSANKICGNITEAKNIIDPSEEYTFFNGASVVNGVYEFDGVDDRMEHPASSKFDFGTNDFTISFWVNFNDLIGYQAIFTCGGYNANSGGITMYSNNNRIEYWTTFQTNVTPNVLSVNTWHSVQLVRVGTTVSVWVDNIEYIMFTGFSGSLSNSVGAQMLGDNTLGTVLLNGKLSGFLLYNKGLTPNELTQNYNSQKHRFEI